MKSKTLKQLSDEEQADAKHREQTVKAIDDLIAFLEKNVDPPWYRDREVWRIIVIMTTLAILVIGLEVIQLSLINK